MEIDINEKSEKLLPGLTVSCRIIIGKVENALLLPIDAIRTEGDVSFVYKKTGKGYEKTVVETGESNSDHIVILRGLEENDTVALSDPYAGDEKDKKENKTEAKEE